MGLSETAFFQNQISLILSSIFFTLTRQIAHCGHATIATLSYLSQQGIIKEVFSSKEKIEGKRENLIQGDLAFMEQEVPRCQHVEK
ncbi:MAG: phenazine biosynthesis protein PhzF family [Ferruginibacter sp.]|nr:phenazine biosynthesis protein PhzF family [Ferruginibacter sp.]